MMASFPLPFFGFQFLWFWLWLFLLSGHLFMWFQKVGKSKRDFEGTSCIKKFLVKMLRCCNISRRVLCLSEYSSRNNMYFHHLCSEWHVKKIFHNWLHLVHLSDSVALFQNTVWKQNRNLAWNLCLFFYMLMTLISVYTWLRLIKL